MYCTYHDRLLFLPVTVHNLFTVKPNTLFKFMLTAKPEYLCRYILCNFLKIFIFIIQNTNLVFILILCNSCFSLNITFHCMMSVQMIRCDVKNRTYLRMKFIYCLQLETAYFCYCHRFFRHLGSILRIRITDISNYIYIFKICFHNLTGKCCSCCFSICSCYGKKFSCTTKICKFNLSPYRYILFLKLHNKR